MNASIESRQNLLEAQKQTLLLIGGGWRELAGEVDKDGPVDISLPRLAGLIIEHIV